MKRFFSIGLFLIFIFASARIFSQKYSFTEYSINEGLPHASIRVLFQDSRGLIWIATNGGGICQYDGYSFYTLSQKESLANKEVNSIAEDLNGNIWFGTDEGVLIFDGNSIIDLSKELLPGFINKLYTDKQGYLWILSNGMPVTRINPEAYQSSKENINEKAGLTEQEFHAITQDSYNRIWLVSDSGFVVLSDKLESIGLGFEYALPEVKITAIDATGSSEMWVGTANSGAFLLSYDSLSSYVKRSYNAYFDNIDDNIVSVNVDKFDNVWLGTNDQGIVYIDYPFVKKLSKANGLKSDQVTDILEDGEGNIWIGTVDNGIISFAGWHFVHYDNEAGLPENAINTITQDREGNFWCSGNVGLYRFIQRNDKLRIFNVLLPEAYQDVKVSAILFPDSNKVLFGTTDQGLLVVSGNEIDAVDVSSGLPNNHITALWSDSENSVWIGTPSGVALLKKDSVTDLQPRFPELKGEIKSIVGGKDEGVWLGSYDGLFNIKNDSLIRITERSGLIHQRINALHIDKHSNLWVGTLGGGLFYARLTNNGAGEMVFRQLLSGTELLSNNVYSVLSLNDSVLILGTDKGANRILLSIDTIPIVNKVYSYDNSNGFRNPECNLNAIYLDENNYVWIGTKSGLTRYDSERERPPSEIPKVYLTGLEVNFEAIKWQSEEHESTEWFAFPDKMKLKHNQNYISFTYYQESIIPKNYTINTFLKGLIRVGALQQSSGL